MAIRLESCPNFHVVNLRDNCIESLGLRNVKLVLARLVSNNITAIHGLEGCSVIQFLTLSQNQVMRVSGMESLVDLQVLDLKANGLVEVQFVSAVASSLRFLDLPINQLKTHNSVEECFMLQHLAAISNMLLTFPNLEDQT